MIVSKVQRQSKVKTSPASKSTAPEISASQDRIRERAFHIYESRGSEPGNDMQDWLRAERQILAR
ncbi:MAG TPA: DUF2934 domain-containing protein [Terracidiphilus sp.]|nr:DUF2934 domain-containing protein [Terracidiphilus sp.]